jgi:hypothetical protein
MQNNHGFIAYPAKPDLIGNTIKEAIKLLKEVSAPIAYQSWEEVDIPGHFISTSILDSISGSTVFVADITRLNFNVTFEIGYAIGKCKRIILVHNNTLKNDFDIAKEVGIFDTIGYKPYANSHELKDYLLSIVDYKPLNISYPINTRSPIYLLLPRLKGDSIIHIISRVKKARLLFRSHDPEEKGRLSAPDAIQNICNSHGVVLPLLTTAHTDSNIHNLRASFVAGITKALDRELLLLQNTGDPVPIDYRDLVSEYSTNEHINNHINEFAPLVYSRLQSNIVITDASLSSTLENIHLGASIADNEMVEISSYFLETDEYRRTQRGEVQIICGRKGSGKTAVFAYLRNRLRLDRNNVVLDLRPEGYQLLKFKDLVLDLLQEGTKEHTITAFWEYLLLLEICHKLIESDKSLHIVDHRLYEPYNKLVQLYKSELEYQEADFAERMLLLISRISSDISAVTRDIPQKMRLATSELTEFLHKHDVHALRDTLLEYLKTKKSVWVLFDNLDKGWPPHGIKPDDLLTVRCLLDALSKLERIIRRQDVMFKGVIFIRNDVFDLLLDSIPDRGKLSRVMVDWSDPELLRELIRRRIAQYSIFKNVDFGDTWRGIFVSHINGEETSQYIIDRCLMRPRLLIEYVQHCISHAVNLGHKVVEESDILYAEEIYSTDTVLNIGYEIRDIDVVASDVLYEFTGSKAILSRKAIYDRIFKQIKDNSKVSTIFDLLLWYGFIGLQRNSNETSYIYTVKYDIKRLHALASQKSDDDNAFCINPAFWKGLEIVV